MKEKISIALILSVLIVFSIGFLPNFNVIRMSKNDIITENSNFQCEMVKKEKRTSFKLKLSKGSVATLGRENWKKGENIKINLQSLSNYLDNLEIGILKAEDMSKGWGYNDYGSFVRMTASNEGILEYEIPMDGEYGILIRDKSTQKIFFNSEKEVVKGRITELTKRKNDKKSKIFNNDDYVNVVFDINKEFKNPLLK